MVHLAHSAREALSRTPPPHHRCGPPLSARAAIGGHGRKEAFDILHIGGETPIVGPLPGVPNLGNTCYMAAVLQCLLNTPAGLREALEAFGSVTSRANGGGADAAAKDPLAASSDSGALTLVTRLAELAAEYGATEGGSLSRDRSGALARFKESLTCLDEKYGECEQQDAFEFLGCLLEGIDDGFRALLRRLACRAPQEGMVRQLCGVTTFSIRRCLQCQARFEVDQTTDITLGLPLVSHAAQMDEALRRQEEARPISLTELLEASQHPEEINGYDCDNCRAIASAAGVRHTRSRMVQRSGLVSAAKDVLIVALYRFLNTVDSDGDFVPVKLRRAVTLPTRLFLAGSEYRLYSVVSHCGMDLSSGHYVAAVRSARDGIWYECDDKVVQPLRMRALYEDAEITGTRACADPFILFYHRVGSDDMNMVD